jgi:hypothetical protein
MALEPAKPIELPEVRYHHAPLLSVGVFSGVAALTTAAAATAPSEKHVAVLTLRAATKRNGPEHGVMEAAAVAALYVVGKPLHGVQPCAVSSATGTL